MPLPQAISGFTLQTRLPARPDEEKGPVAPVNLEKLIARMREIPALQPVVLRVLHFSQKEDASSRAMAQIIAMDATLTLRVLKLANSACYGLSRSVSSLTDAVVLLGSHSIRHIALVASTHEVLHQEVDGYAACAENFWRHALTSAMAAQILAEHVGYVEPDEAFVAGLLHDIGKIVLSSSMQDASAAVETCLEKQALRLHQVERAVLGMDHAEAGARLALRWNLPPALIQAIAWHHSPERAQRDMLSALTQGANALAWQIGEGAGIEVASPTCIEQTQCALKLDDSQWEAAAQELYVLRSQADPLLELETV